MIYVDTSVLVALYLPEGKSDAVGRWYTSCKDTLISAAWCVSEFASALSIKQRTGQIDASAAHKAWQQFERMCASDLQLLPVDHSTFHHAAILALDVKSGLRSGDALHLAAALDFKARSMATLDDLLAKNARQMKLNIVAI
jgi:predicted nucleic acid-binding protein